MLESQNGWPVIAPGMETTNTPSTEPRLRRFVIPGTGRGFWLRDGAAGFVLAHWALVYHDRIQPLNRDREWDDWGYAYRPVRAGIDWSNHASGTAVDFNALKHPLGKRGTFVYKWKVQRLNKRLRTTYRNLLRWGGNYEGRADEMHTEIVGTPNQIRALAIALAATPRGKRILDANPGLKSVL